MALIQPAADSPSVPEFQFPKCLAFQQPKHFASSQDAFIAGQYFAALNGDRRAGDILAAQSVGTDDKGGYSVPDPLSSSLINLLEDFGIARRRCRRIVMGSNTWQVPKLINHAAISYPDEAAAIGLTDVTFDQVQLVAKKIAAIVKMSTEIVEDSIVSMMDTVVSSLAYSIAIAEDSNLFNGVVGGINTVGIKGDAGVAEISTVDVDSLTLDTFTDVVIASGVQPIECSPAWYINPTLYYGKIRNLLNDAQGNHIGNLENGQSLRLLGYPVHLTSVLPQAPSAVSGDLLAVFGDLSVGCYFGDRRTPTFKVLNELYAENDQLGIQVTERIDARVVNPEVLSRLVIA